MFHALVMMAVWGLADDGVVKREELAKYLQTTGRERAKDHWRSLEETYQQHIAIQKSLKGDKRRQKQEIDRLTAKLKDATDKARDPAPMLPDLAAHKLQVGAVGILYTL